MLQCSMAYVRCSMNKVKTQMGHSKEWRGE